MHYTKIRNFMLKEQIEIKLESQPIPDVTFSTPQELVQYVYELELKTEQRIHEYKPENKIEQLFIEELLLIQHQDTIESFELVEFSKQTKDMFLIALQMKNQSKK